MAENAEKQKCKQFFPLKRDLKKRLTLHVKIVAGEMKLDAESKGNLTTLPVSIPARFILNDITSTSAALFSTRALLPGTSVHIEIFEPSSLKVKGKIRWCREVGGSRKVVSDQHFSHRIAVQFDFPKEGEAEAKKAVEDFLQSISTDHLHFHIYE